MDELAYDFDNETEDFFEPDPVEAIPTADAKRLAEAKAGLKWAQSAAGMREYEKMRDRLFARTGVSEIYKRKSFVRLVRDKHLELALRASAITGMAPETVLAFWNQEGSIKTAGGRKLALAKNQSVGSLKAHVNSKEHALALTISFLLWDVYGLDEAVNLIPRKEAEKLVGKKDSLVHPADPAKHRRRLRRMIKLGIKGGFLNKSLDMERGFRKSVSVSEQGASWKIAVRPEFDALALTLLASTVMLYAQHKYIAKSVSKETREKLVLSNGELLPPDMVRIAFNMGPGSVKSRRGLNYQIHVADKELDAWLNKNDQRIEIRNWAKQVLALAPLYEATMKKTATQQQQQAFLAEVPHVLATHQAFVVSAAGKAALSRSYRKISSSLSTDLHKDSTQRAWRRFFSRFKGIALQVLADWDTWETAPLVNAGIWIVSAYRFKPTLKRWQRAMRPITRRKTAQMTAVKQRLFRLDARRIFHAGGRLQFP